ncbi:MAG TPA: anti-sigma factor [Gemmatimonadota bacterium]|nr:anti-sigma factor [Gemmatimonadota bacterium]
MIRPAGMADDQFEELAIAHLLGELDVNGEIMFQEELARRGAPGSAMLREFREALGELALAVAPADPPPALRARVLWSIGAPVAAPDAPPAAPRTFWIWAVAALMAAMAVGLGVWAGRLADERDELREDLELVGSTGSTVRELRGAAPLPDARARVFLAAGSGHGVLLAHGLPAIGPDRVYALWMMDAGNARPVGVFRPDEDGRGRLDLVDLELGAGAVLAVTEEPAPGSERPTGAILLTSR